MCGQFIVDEGRNTRYEEDTNKKKTDETMMMSLTSDRSKDLVQWAKGLLTIAFVNQIRPYNHLLGKAKHAQASALER